MSSQRLGSVLADRVRHLLPDPFVFALGLTILVGGLALLSTPSGPLEVLDAWYRGFWILLEFGMQIVLVLATGYAIALSPAAGRGIDALARRISTPAQVYLIVMLLGGLLTLVSWSWVVLTAVLARELASRVEGLDYGYLTACVFFSSWSWVCGLSSSIPLLLNTDGNFLIETGVLASTLGVSRTLGSGLNLAYLAVGAIVFPALMVALRPRGSEATPIRELVAKDEEVGESVAEEAHRTRLPGRALSDRLNHSATLLWLVVVCGLIELGSIFRARGFDIDLNLMIFLFVLLGLAAHQTPMRYVVAMKRSCGNVSGIVFQYPFYAGIMGMTMYTGLGAQISDWMVQTASPLTLPAIAQLAGAAVNFAIPSAGGEWAVVGPSFMEAAQSLGSQLPPDQLEALMGRVAMAVAYGETSTNLLQPFFLLVILPVMGAGVRIQARDVVGHLVLPFFVEYSLAAILLTFVPL
jgi:short-chain fatty acids transporter